SILSMIGEWSGNTRSTPTPKLILRTVNVAVAPPPWRAMTTPSKTWIRSRPPSTTRTCTFTLSPARKLGMSSRSWAFSSSCRSFMGAPGRSVLVGAPRRTRRQQATRGNFEEGRRPRTRTREESVSAIRSRYEPLPQIRSSLLGSSPTLLLAPGGDSGVVARQKHVRDLLSLKLGRLRVDRLFEEAVPEGLVCNRLRIADDPRQQAGHGFDHHESRRLSAGEHVVADRNLLVDVGVDDPLVDPFVPPADQREVLQCGEPVDDRLIERDPRRAHQHPMRVGQRFEGGDERLDPHHHPGPAAVGRVVDLTVPTEPMAADVVDVDRENACVDGALDQPH